MNEIFLHHADETFSPLVEEILGWSIVALVLGCIIMLVVLIILIFKEL